MNHPWVSALQPIPRLDSAAMQQAQARWDSIAKPLHSLGILESTIVQMAGILETPNVDLGRRAAVVFCADNGVVEEGVTQTGSEITSLVAENMAKGISCINVMAKAAGASVIPVDIGMKETLSIPGLRQEKVAPGTNNITRGPAMTQEQAIRAMEIGMELVRECKEQGCGVLAAGEMGIGNTTIASAVASVLLQRPPEEVTGRGAGLSTPGLHRKIQVVWAAIAKNQPDPSSPLDVLAKIGSLDLAGMAGMFLGGAKYRLPILIDGVTSAAAALIAVRLCPACSQTCFACHVSGEPAGPLLLQALGKQPLLTCGMRLGEATGAIAALPIIDMALTVYHSMGTFQDIHMDPYQPLE